MKGESRISLFVYYFIAFIFVLIFLLPMWWMILSSFKVDEVIFRDLSTINAFLPKFSDLSLKPYKQLLSLYNIFKNILNSIVYASLFTILGLFINSTAGYALAALNFRGKKIILTSIIILIIVPIETVILPIFLVVNSLHWINTILGLLVPFVASSINIFLFRQYFLNVPKELSEAAQLDGLGDYGIFFKIITPTSVSIFATIAVLSFLASWNDFLWPVMVMTKTDLMPVQVALNAIFSDRYNIGTSHTMAALSLATIPIVLFYMLFQRYIRDGIAVTGIK